MITIQIVPQSGHDAYKMLRDKVTHDAHTFSWKNKAKTRLVHKTSPSGYIEVVGAENIVNAQIYPQKGDAFRLAEKLIGRLVAWFPNELFAINIQFILDAPKRGKRRK